MASVEEKTGLEEDFESYIPICQECGEKESDVIQDDIAGVFVCRNCGVVAAAQVISDGTEWRTFSADSQRGKTNVADPDRVGGRALSREGDVELTMMGRDPNAGTEDELSISKYGRSAVRSRDRSLSHAHNLVGTLATRMKLPSVIVEECNELYRSLGETNQLKGRGIETVVTACLYIVLRRNNVPRTLKELCSITDVKKRDVSRCFSKVAKLADLKKQIKSDYQTSNTDGSLFLERFCSMLKLPQAVVNAARDVANNAKELAEGKSPATIAAAAIYMASQLHPTEKRSFKEIADVAHLSDQTIRGCFRLFYPDRLKVVPKDFASQSAIQNMSPN
eukprot:TRINITY_DN2866_c0_g1_i4.p1 TRINITY_DN2866_c0_g1~~TRINITY_DN2866_c0_g1_i4.p1  ORF type:complete len:335 (+),score=53.77 TRINITY_DN2866_c0_g1_i4:84-1088(+)